MLKITTILLLTFILRIYGINWDQGTHLHPDERMLIMVAERIHFFDKLNPDFFNYGSLPVYLLRGLAQIIDSLFGLHLGNYDGMLSLGRFLSISVDVLTAYFVYLIANLIFKNKKIALLSAFFYSISFFPIQNAHFFIADTFLTFFLTVLLYLLLSYREKPSWQKISLLAIVSAAAITTKITAIIFLPVVGIVLLFRNVILGTPTSRRRTPESGRRDSGQARMTLISVLLFTSSLLVFSFIFMPYSYLNWHKFLTDIMVQIKLNSDPYIFPYTLQYVGTVPYLYYLKNIFLWGLGPITSLLSVLGIYFLFKDGLSLRALAKQSPSKMRSPRPPTSRRSPRDDIIGILLFVFYLFYFLIIGRSAVKFMRYMLPLYPFFTILAGYGLYSLSFPRKRESRSSIKSRMTLGIFLIGGAIWTLMFLNIYSHEHTRITATKWIQQNIPSGSTLAVEHWDDALPLSGGEKYNFVELTLYDQPDDAQKWKIMNEKLGQTDYVILSSNRLYVPLQRLTDCQKFKVCYPKTSEYYRKLFNGQLGFQKAAEFTVYPGFKIGNLKLEINDSSADESFTVYDHPKVIIFKKS